MTATTGSRYLSMLVAPIVSRSFRAGRYPTRMIPPVQTIPPMVLHSRNRRSGMCNIPATGLRNVRTTGTNRASRVACSPRSAGIAAGVRNTG
jgi:hypothetical protein